MTQRFITHRQARRFYDRIGRAQDARPVSERRALDALATHGAFAEAAVVLEFGCGTGRTAPARLVTALWQAIWRLNPALLGGCRPLTLRGLLDPEQWDVRAGMSVTDWFLSSDVLVARRR